MYFPIVSLGLDLAISSLMTATNSLVIISHNFINKQNISNNSIIIITLLCDYRHSALLLFRPTRSTATLLMNRHRHRVDCETWFRVSLRLMRLMYSCTKAYAFSRYVSFFGCVELERVCGFFNMYAILSEYIIIG